MEYTCRTGPKTIIKAYNPDGPCPTICTDGIIIYDPSPGAECFRRVHSSELMRMHGMPADFNFPAHFTEAQKVRLIGLGMDGYSTLALGNAIRDYIRGTFDPKPVTQCAAPSFTRAMSTSWQQPSLLAQNAHAPQTAPNRTNVRSWT